MANSELGLGLIDEHFDSGAAADFRLKGPLQLVEYVQVVFAFDAEGFVQRQRLQIVVCETGKFNNKIPEILLVLLLGKVLAVCTVCGRYPSWLVAWHRLYRLTVYNHPP